MRIDLRYFIVLASPFLFFSFVELFVWFIGLSLEGDDRASVGILVFLFTPTVAAIALFAPDRSRPIWLHSMLGKEEAD